MRGLLTSFVAFYFFVSFSCKAQIISGKTVAITDGDTFKLLTADSTLYRVRLANIDCPERRQPFSKRAKQFASDAIFGKEVCIEVLSTDRNGRLIANVFYDANLVLNEEFLKAGLAWHFRRYSRDPGLQQLEDRARKAKVGLWITQDAVPPWEWRSSKRVKAGDR